MIHFVCSLRHPRCLLWYCACMRPSTYRLDGKGTRLTSQSTTQLQLAVLRRAGRAPCGRYHSGDKRCARLLLARDSAPCTYLTVALMGRVWCAYLHRRTRQHASHGTRPCRSGPSVCSATVTLPWHSQPCMLPQFRKCQSLMCTPSSFLLKYIADEGIIDTFPLYLDYKFSWSPLQVGGTRPVCFHFA